MKAAELTEHAYRRLRRIIHDHFHKKHLPAFWRFDGEHGSTGIRLAKGGVLDGKIMLSVIVEAEEHDGADWWHLSAMGHPARLPTWDELNEARAVTLGDRQMVQVLAPKSEHFTIAPVLHLWCRVDGARLVPDLRALAPDGTVGL